MKQSDVDRFWKKVKKGDGCWIWRAAKFHFGHGAFWLNGGNKKASRVSWEINFGKIPENLCVCHKCDNPSCVNPEHLFLGTQLENVADRDSKNRQAKIGGEDCPQSKLKSDDVDEIKRLLFCGVSQSNISKIFGISQTAISKINTGKTWKCLNSESH